MNTSKLKDSRFVCRLKKAGNKHFTPAVPVSTTPKTTEPCINQLYAIDFNLNGAIQTNVTARYTGRSKSGKFMNFELPAFFNLKGVRLHLVCLNSMPSKMVPLSEDLLSIAA